ncbi:MAG: glycine zipper 2TM domain-containing protein [Candidatus Omnitrophica bacterium]|nr:glycine zipper 2TM domain-containing protein [Candidatus Omnitrophota bacterium]
MRYLIISLLVLMLVTVSGCTTTEKGATYGGLLGAGAGAIIGNQSDHALGGAAIGGLAGAAAGALIGNTMEED